MAKGKAKVETVFTTVTTETTTTTTVKTNVESKPTQMIVILDRSGSMESIGKATVEGLNTLIKEQKGAEGEAFLTLVQFDDQYQIDYKSKPIKEVNELIYGETFKPRGMTAMYDAIGKTIAEVETTDDVVLVIVTDGAENASREFTQKIVFDKIEEKKKAGWNVLFLAANQDAMRTGGSIGIDANNSMTFNTNAGSVNASYQNISGKLSSYRSSKLSADASNVGTLFNFTDADRKDINK
jgi:hypothetical protein